MSSRLFVQVRERLGLVYDIHSYADRLDDTGMLVIYAGMDPPACLHVIREILAALANGASLLTRSSAVPVTLGGTPNGGGTPVAPSNANGFNNFSLVPEPSTVVLGFLGAAALLLRRRR